MKTEILNKLLSEALLLPEAERTELAHALVKSLDAPDDADALEAWRSKFCAGLLKLMQVPRSLLIEVNFGGECKHGLAADRAPGKASC